MLHIILFGTMAAFWKIVPPKMNVTGLKKYQLHQLFQSDEEFSQASLHF